MSIFSTSSWKSWYIESAILRNISNLFIIVYILISIACCSKDNLVSTSPENLIGTWKTENYPEWGRNAVIEFKPDFTYLLEITNQETSYWIIGLWWFKF